MSAPVFIRTASKKDIPAVRDLLVETWHNTYDAIFDPATVAAITEEWCSIEALEKKLSAPASEFVLSDSGGKLHAMAFATQEGKTVRLHQLYVLPASQGRGIGTELMQELFFCFDAATRVELDVHPENAQAIGFYKSGGFAEIGKIEVSGPAGLLIPHVVLGRALDD